MSALTTLIRHEAREARAALIAAPLLTLVALVVIHASFARAGSLAYASASTAAVLVALWTVYFAADLVASDSASGRLRTKALLPVSSSELWRAKLAFLALVVVALGVATIASAWSMHALFGADRSLALFETTMVSMAPLVMFLPLVAASAVLCSLVAESALVAILLSLVVDVGLVGLGVGWSRAWEQAGVAWTGSDSARASLPAALLLFALGGLAFRRGQRRLGAIGARARTIALVLGGVALVGGAATATEIWRRVHGGLEHPCSRLQAASSSPDGRYLAIESESSIPACAHGSRSVWILDLENGTHELAAAGALLLRDRVTWQPMPWDATRAVRVERDDVAELDDVISTIRFEGERVETDSAPFELRPCVVPDWAEIGFPADGERTLTVRWRDRGVARTFTHTDRKAALGRDVFLSSRAGRVLYVEDRALRIADLDAESARTLVPEGVALVTPSPDGSAVSVLGNGVVRVLSTLDGADLLEPWPDGPGWPQWISGSARALRFADYGAVRRDRIFDLDTSVEFEIRTNRDHGLIHRLPDGGYVYVDEHDDLVRVDARGERIAVLVDR